jgi:hypothetical protein
MSKSARKPAVSRDDQREAALVDLFDFVKETIVQINDADESGHIPEWIEALRTEARRILALHGTR